MKTKAPLILLSLLLTLSCLFASCNANKQIFPEENDSSEIDDYTATIQSLEQQILELQQNQYISELERQEELTRLQNLLAQLKNDSTENPSDGSGSQKLPSASEDLGKFLYNIEDNYAIITGYTGSESILVIPSVIDGYTVSEIGDSAFSSEKIKSVIISNGIQRIGWFSFQGCPNLSSVTIPTSVTSIGYSAFYTQTKGFTIYCTSGSFAQQYAKSYGISFATI